MVMDRLQLQIGDRIALLQPYVALSPGAQGAITYVYQTEPGLYRVRFDASTHELPVYVHYLSHLTGGIDASDGSA
jgi:hypothetical protein